MEQVLDTTLIANEIFFFLIGKGIEEGYINKNRVPNGQSKAYKKYMTDAYRQKKKRKERKVQKKLTCPHLEPNQSKKLIKELGSSSIYDLVQDQKLQTKKYFII